MSKWAAILAGGSGTRFWPLSTPSKPKQMLNLSGQQSLLESTVSRLQGLIEPEQILILTGRHLVDDTQRLLPDLPKENVLAEPKAASTAPALTWATVAALERDPEASLLSVHADWHVGDDPLFRETAAAAFDTAETHDLLVTVGIVPTRPETGYGYILPGDALAGGTARRVKKFLEKPDAERAAQLIDAGALWNSGMFAWTGSRYLEETKQHAPEIAPFLEHLRSGDIETFFHAVTPIAVDVSHFERSEKVACVPGRFLWDDVGTWAALGRVRDLDERGNVQMGSAFARDSSGCVVWAADGKVVVDGVEDLVVVQANGVTMVTTKNRCSALKDLLNSLPPEIRSLP